MFCINCFHKKTTVTNSRSHKKQPSIWRRRHCEHCDTVFTTDERPRLAGTSVHRPDGTSEPFNPGQLTISINGAFRHAPDEGKKHAFWLAETVETSLVTQTRLITSEEIEAITHQTLKAFDEVAAVQYAAQQQLIVACAKRRGRPSLVSRA